MASYLVALEGLRQGFKGTTCSLFCTFRPCGFWSCEWRTESNVLTMEVQYRVSHVVADLGWVYLYLAVPPS